MWHVYIVECRDGSLYTGISNDVGRRIDEHNSGLASKYTRGRIPVRLVYQEQFQNRSRASKREHQIKQLNAEEKRKLFGCIDE